MPTETKPKPKLTALAPWFGSNRTLAENVGAALAGCTWVGVPFAGGMSELAHIKARTLLVSDLHKHVVNLASVLADPKLGPTLVRRLRRVPFHEDALLASQAYCRLVEEGNCWSPLDWAERYFVSAWMSRNASAGTKKEFSAPFSARWTDTGGDSATRWRSAVAGLGAWRAILARCTFVCLDVFAFLDKVKDRPRHGLYLDAPWPGDGDSYRHKFTADRQRELAARLAAFGRCKVVVRYGDHPLIRELYPADKWEWNAFTGRTAGNNGKAEVLLVNRCCAPADGAQK